MTHAPLAVLVDFDDTAAAQNAAEAVLEQFGDAEWRTLREAFRRRVITLREYQEQAFNSIGASLEEMSQAAPGLVSLRPGLDRLHSFCQAHDIQLAIVTNSLDFYVRAILTASALRDTPVHAVTAIGQPGGLTFQYPHADDSCPDWGWGNCKCQVLEGYRQDGARIIYIGDGRSDLCVARRADYVFARSTLLDHCRELGLPHQGFHDFTDVVDTMERSLDTGWIPPRHGAWRSA